MIKIDISPDIIKEDKSIIEDLVVAAHNNAKEKLKLKPPKEIISLDEPVSSMAAIAPANILVDCPCISM